jgi:acetylornithine deacetylase/succinyl-diaminopimelate desuccinylase-like protein
MAVDELRSAVNGLMARAKEDLAELASFRSVADPRQFSPEDCQKAAQWVVDAFAAAGLQDVRMSLTPDGSHCVHGHAPGPEGSPTVLLNCGSIPLCNVLAETYPDAEIMLMGVEEPRCLIHAPNESVDRSEIENMALSEALFLRRYASAASVEKVAEAGR